MKTNAKRLFAGLFLGAAAVLWVGHAADSPAKINVSKVISNNHEAITANIAATEATFISINTTTTDSLTYEATGANVNKVVSSLDAAPIFKEGGAALCATMTPATQNVNINGTSSTSVISTGAMGTSNNSPTASINPVSADTLLNRFAAAGNEGVPAPEIASTTDSA